MKRGLILAGFAIAAFSSCTVVYQNPAAGTGGTYASNSSRQAQQQNYNQYGNGNDVIVDDSTGSDNEPLIDFNNNYYDNGYVYNPYYYGAGFYAGNPFWGVGLYPSWSYGFGYSPFGWGIGIGYGWGGYYGWGSMYYGWGGMYGWPGYYGWGSGWGWGGGYYRGGYSPYIVRSGFARGNRAFVGRNGINNAGVSGARGSRGNIAGFNRAGTSFNRGGNNLSVRNISSNANNNRIISNNGFNRASRVERQGSGMMVNRFSNSNGSFDRASNMNNNSSSSFRSQQSYSRPQTQQSFQRAESNTRSSAPSFNGGGRSFGGFSGGGGGRSFGGGGGGGRGGRR